MIFDKLDHWHQTKPGYTTFGLLELALAYLFGSLAIDDGNLLVYLLAFILFVGGLNNLFRAFKKTKLGSNKI